MNDTPTQHKGSWEEDWKELVKLVLKDFVRHTREEAYKEGRQSALTELLEVLPLNNRWDDKTKRGYEKNGAVEDPETGRNPVLKEVRDLITNKLNVKG